jgi:mono/diheme cytochrome c family protein
MTGRRTLNAALRRDAARALILGIGALLVTGGDLWAAGADAGRRLARQWCVECHIVEPPQESASDAAPPFESIALDPTKTPEGLRTWLADPHPPMPNPQLSRGEIEDILALHPKLGRGVTDRDTTSGRRARGVWV